MTIDVFFARPVSELMEKALREHKNWMAYPTHAFITGNGDLQFFSAKKEAEDFCIEKRRGHVAYSHREVPPVYAGLSERVSRDAGRDDISHYVILSGANISATLKPNADHNPLHNREAVEYFDQFEVSFKSDMKNDLTVSGTDGPHLNADVMNQENLIYLQNSLKYHGFGDALNAKLEENIKSGVSQFTIEYNETHDSGKMRYTFQFGKGQHKEMYYLNKYDAMLTKPDGREVAQTFYFDNGRAFKRKEAFNLLDGRSVNRDFERPDGTKYDAWVKLDFESRTGDSYQLRRFRQNYGYDLEKALEKLPVAELKHEEQREALVRALRRGDLRAVNFEEGGQVSKRFIAADPEFKGMRVYDETLKEITTQLRNSKHIKELQKPSEAPAKGLRVGL